MKGVKLEDVTGEKAVRSEPGRRTVATGEAGIIGRPKTIEEQMDDAAGQAAWAIVACYVTAVYLVVTTIIGILRGAPITVAFTAMLFAALLASCAWFMTRRSKTAAIIAISAMALLGLGVIINAFLLSNAAGIFKVIKVTLALAATANGVSGIFTYHRLAKQVDHKKMSNDHIKDVFGDTDAPVKEGT